jgi:hypothetical protein
VAVTDYERGFRAGVEAAAKMAEDCIANGYVVLSAGEVASAIRSLAPDAQPRGEGE